jgi:ribosomal protein S1
MLTDEDFIKLTSKFKLDKKLTVEIVNIAPFGLFVTIPVKGSDVFLEGFIHISEIAWEKTAELTNLFTVGQQIEAVIIKFDTEGRKVQLSVKRLTKDPFEGTVEKVEDGGISVRLEEDVEGFIRRAKLPPSVTYVVGQKITALVSDYDKKRKRVFLVPVLLEKPIGYR